MPVFTPADLKAIGECRNILDTWSASGVSTDSRDAQTSQMFFALQGARFDALAFVHDVAARGIVCVVTAEAFARYASAWEKLPLVIVQDTLHALQRLAENHRQKSRAKVIGVTGSNGKTTTKEMLKAVMSKTFITQATEGNLNNEIGVPLTLLKLEADTQVAVIEMGADRPGDIETLCRIIKPDFGIVTNIGKAHIERFGRVEAVAETKTALYRHLINHGVRFVNTDDPFLRDQTELAGDLVTYGVNQSAQFRGTILEVSDKGCISLRIEADKSPAMLIRLGVPGLHHAYNVLAAVAVAKHMPMPDEAIVQALEAYRQPANRVSFKEKNGITVMDDTYNANPNSMRAAMDTLMSIKTSGRKIAVLADMLELGAMADNEHRDMGAYAAEKKVDALYLTGPLAVHAMDGAQGMKNKFYFEDKARLIEMLKDAVQPGDVVLVKGSRGMKMEDIVQAILA
ncbi:MAG TPA: UDP-N-acetylmuramoyl-tripeptide--D-alanyl-D-alanine ligase [bacterium]|nr:UDP-N-acetylmuramoyl-tripeptide--D-alanyl-D-alanine ligase [bacterium]